MWVGVAISALLLLPFVAIVIVGLLERNVLRDLAPLPPGRTVDLSPYVRDVSAAAEKLGFKAQGLYGTTRGGIYADYVSLWLSPDAESLVTIGGGTVGGLTVRKTVLYSRVADERYILTTDETIPCDYSGVLDTKILLNANLGELLCAHRNRLAGRASPFTPERALEEFECIHETRARRLEQLGCAKFTADRASWRYTLKGVLRYWFVSVMRALAQGSRQLHRVDVRRPGE
jgi:hypothetical protein